MSIGFSDNPSPEEEPTVEDFQIPTSFNLRFNIASLSNPIYPAYCQMPRGQISDLGNNCHADLKAFKISEFDTVNGKFWSWIRNPSKNLQEIEVRHECIEEIISRGKGPEKLLEELEKYFRAVSRLNLILGGDDLLAEEATPNIQKHLVEHGIDGVNRLMLDWRDSLESLESTLLEIRKFDSTITYSAVTEVKEAVNRMPRPDPEEITLAVGMGLTSTTAQRIRDLYYPSFKYWKDDSTLIDSVVSLMTLLSVARIVKSEDFCSVKFDQDNEFFKDSWNLTLQMESNESEMKVSQTKGDSPEDFPVIVLKGSNMGGKSFFLQRRLYITLMAQTFKYAPCKEAVLNIYDSIHVIERGRTESGRKLSSFGSAQRNVIDAFKNLGSRALFIADELASETDTQSEAGFVYGIPRTLKEAGARVIIATHSEDGMLAFQKEPWAKIYHFKVNKTPWSEIEFTYQLTEGADGSHALEVARMGGAPEVILNIAEQYLQGTKLEINPPKTFKTPLLPDTDECWNGFGWLIPPGREWSPKKNIIGKSWISDRNTLNDPTSLELSILKKKKNSQRDLTWSDPGPKESKGFALYLTQDSDFGACHPKGNNPFRWDISEKPFFSINCDDLVAALSVRPRRILRKDPIVAAGRILSIRDVLERRSLIHRLQKNNFSKTLELLSHDIATVHTQWHRLLESQTDIKYESIYDEPKKMALKMISQIQESNYGSSNEKLARGSKERAISYRVIAEILRQLPQSKERDSVLLITEEYLETLKLIALEVYSPTLQREQLPEKVQSLDSALIKKLGGEVDKELYGERAKWRHESVWKQLSFYIYQKIDQLEPGTRLSLSEPDKRVDSLVKTFDTAIKEVDELTDFDDAEYYLRLLRAGYTEQDFKKDFVDLLAQSGDPRLQKAAKYYESVIDAIFGSFKTAKQVQSVHEILQAKGSENSWEGYRLYGTGHFGFDASYGLRHSLAPIVLACRLAEHLKKEQYADVTFNDSYAMQFEDLYHPERNKKDFVPNSLELSADTRLFILSGPNMSGKSELLKAITWAILSARNAGVVCGKSGALPPFSRVVYLDRVSESTDEGLSGWGTDISNMNVLCEFVGIDGIQEHPCLVVLNEFGTSTTAADQGAIKAGLAKVLIEAGHTVIYEGHDHCWIDRMSRECSNLCRVSHLAYDLDPNSPEGVKFHHKLVDGVHAPSLGIAVSRRLGMPEAVLTYANSIIK